MPENMASLVASVSPYPFQNQIATNSSITVTFIRDINSDTLTNTTVQMTIAGTETSVPVTLSYAAMALTITPTGPLLSNTTYQITLVGDVDPADNQGSNITGIKDILGNGFGGVWTTEFTTNVNITPEVPVLISPGAQSATLTEPTFTWTPVTAPASGLNLYYQIQVSQHNDFDALVWPQNSGDAASNYLQTSSYVLPDVSFAQSLEYWWRVRAIVAPASASYPPVDQVSSTGDWSRAWNFYYGDPTQGSVTPEDVPLGFPVPITPVSVITTSPLPGSSNLVNYPSTITAILSGQINLSGLNTSNFSLYGEPVDGDWDPGSVVPVFAPSLNGSMFGSGGYDYPGPVDRYQAITSAGFATGGIITGTYNSVLNQTTLTLTVSGYFQDNNIYTATLNLPELQGPVEWQFSGSWSPLFSSARSVRNWTDVIMPELTDDNILYKIRHNTLYAIMIQVYPPTQIDGESWVYQPPMSFNIDQPPFFARKYVELKTAYDILRAKYWSLLVKPKTTLGDFTVDHDSGSLSQNIMEAVKDLKAEILPYEDKLHGHTNRGYARGQWGLRGSGIRGSGASSGWGNGSRDNSYIWPRTSRPKW